MAKSKPHKPYPSFPLTAHANGQWCKKIRGKIHFFGVWADPNAALQRYLAQAGDLHAGRMPRQLTVSPGSVTVKDVCNAFLNWQKAKLDGGEIGLRWFEDCRTILVDFADSVGKLRIISDVRPEDLQRYRARLAKKLGVHALTRAVGVVRSVLKYAYETELIDRPVRLGTVFARPSAAQKRKAKSKAEQENGKRLFTGGQIREMLGLCATYLQAPILLGINGAFGNTDCATLPLKAIDFNAAVIEYDRPKTGIRRVVPLWPETLTALREATGGGRPTPADEAAAKLALLTPTGMPWVRHITITDQEDGTERGCKLDRLSHAFADLLKKLRLGRKGIGFYALRHTFRTWADEVKDQHAIHRIMGHTIPGMSGIYVEEISLDRLRAVVNHVRSKIFSQ